MQSTLLSPPDLLVILLLAYSPIQILAGALHIVAQIVARTSHAGRIERLLAAQRIV